MDLLAIYRERWGVHHPWCNFFAEEHADTCSMCGPTAKNSLNKDYPVGDKTPEELMKEHFPNNRRVGN